MTLPDPIHAYTPLTTEQRDRILRVLDERFALAEHGRKVRARVWRLLAWSALVTTAFVCWEVML